MTVIDAHQHLWDLQALEYAWLKPTSGVLYRNYLPDDLAPLLREAGVDRTILVQANHALEENHWALRLADDHDFIAGVVGNAPLTDPSVGEVLDSHASHAKFRGIRINVNDSTTNDGRVPADLLRGLVALDHRALSLDLLIRAAQLSHVPVLANAAPQLHIIIDHIGVPQIGPALDPAWVNAIRAAAACPNVYCKLSGMVTICGDHEPTADLLRPWVMTVVEAFGAERCMFGSDWPVSLRAKPYGVVKQFLCDAIDELSTLEQAHILGDTAARAYRLPT